MPRDSAVGDIYEVRWVGSCFLQTINLVHHYRVRTINAGVAWTDVVQEMKDDILSTGGGAGHVEPLYRACLPPEYLSEKVDFQVVYPIRLAKITVDLPGSGTNDEHTETANQAAVITFRSEDTGRKEVANYHIGPIPQHANAQDEGYLTEAYKTELANLADGMFQTIVDAGTGLVMDPVIYHRDAPNAISSYSLFFSYLVQPTIRTMRRRTVGLGS